VSNRVVVTLIVVLAEVCGVAGAKSLSVISASEDTVLSILVQDVGIEEHTGTGSNSSNSVALIVCGLLETSSCAYGWIVWLGQCKCLDTHIGTIRSWSVNGGGVEKGWAIKSRERLRCSRVCVGSSLNNVELSLVLANVCGIEGGDESPEEGTLYTCDRGRVGAGIRVWVLRGVTLEICNILEKFQEICRYLLTDVERNTALNSSAKRCARRRVIAGKFATDICQVGRVAGACLKILETFR